MIEATPATLKTLLAAEFDRQGWEYDLTVGAQLVAAIEDAGKIDSSALAQNVPVAFLHRNRTTREYLAAAIDRAIGAAELKPEVARTVTLAFQDNRRYEVNLSGGSRIENSRLNLGEGMQINVEAAASKEDVLAALEALLRGGLEGKWNGDAVAQLGGVIDGRGDVGVDDVRAVTAEVIKAELPEEGRVRELLDRIAAAGLGGALSTGISAGLGQLLANPPL